MTSSSGFFSSFIIKLLHITTIIGIDMAKEIKTIIIWISHTITPLFETFTKPPKRRR
jgi:hypothetical protein